MFKSKTDGRLRKIAETKNRPQGFEGGTEYDAQGGTPIGASQAGRPPFHGRDHYHDEARAAQPVSRGVNNQIKKPIK